MQMYAVPYSQLKHTQGFSKLGAQPGQLAFLRGNVTIRSCVKSAEKFKTITATLIEVKHQKLILTREKDAVYQGRFWINFNNGDETLAANTQDFQVDLFRIAPE